MKTIGVIAILLVSMNAYGWTANHQDTFSTALHSTAEGTIGYMCGDEYCSVVLWQDDLACNEDDEAPGLAVISGKALEGNDGTAHVKFECASGRPDEDGDYLMGVVFIDLSEETVADFMMRGDAIRLLIVSASHEFVAYTFTLNGSSKPVAEDRARRIRGNTAHEGKETF